MAPSILHRILLKYENGPLILISDDNSTTARLLLAYYRILQANRQLPGHLLWPLSPLSALFWSPDVENGIRLLAIRCYALQSGMGESEREKLEQELLGERECFIEFGQNFDGTLTRVDAWILPIIEMRRIKDAREELATVPQEYYASDSEYPLQFQDLR